MKIALQPASQHCSKTSLLPSAARRPLKIQAKMAETTPSLGLKNKGLISRLGQSFNGAGIVLFGKVALADRQLAIPHLSVEDISTVQWQALKDAGFEGCVFDKDNTLTEPYKLEIHPAVKASLDECMRVFNGRAVLYSNSAGLEQFDPEGKEAEELEKALGIPVLRHREKKPAGGAEDIEKHFGQVKCKAERLVMVGDRYLTDIVFGNRLGMLTVRPQPFTSEGETKAVKLARVIEETFVARCQGARIQPKEHPLVPDSRKLGTFA